MPYLKIQTNVSLDEEGRDRLLAAASQRVAEALGKPEGYVMVAVEDQVPMRFAGSPAPLTFMELKSIGLEESQTPELSRRLCELAALHLDVAADRVYIEFAAAPRPMWGWKGGTF